MKHRVEVDMSFDNKKEAIDLLNYIENIKDKGYKPTGKEKIPVQLTCRYHECTHEEATPVKCDNYINIDFNSVKKTYK